MDSKVEYSVIDLSDRLQIAMDARGMRQADVCKLAGINRSKLSMIMSGKTKDPQLSTCVALCSALGISMAYLAGLTDDVDG